MSEVFGFEAMMREIHEATERAERNTVRELHRLIDFDEPSGGNE